MTSVAGTSVDHPLAPSRADAHDAADHTRGQERQRSTARDERPVRIAAGPLAASARPSTTACRDWRPQTMSMTSPPSTLGDGTLGLRPSPLATRQASAGRWPRWRAARTQPAVFLSQARTATAAAVTTTEHQHYHDSREQRHIGSAPIGRASAARPVTRQSATGVQRQRRAEDGPQPRLEHEDRCRHRPSATENG